MDSQNDKTRAVCAPAVPYFVAVAAGILLDVWTNPGSTFWISWASVSVAAVFGETLFSWFQELRRSSETSDASTDTNDWDENDADASSSLKSESLELDDERKDVAARIKKDDSTFWERWLQANPESNELRSKAESEEKTGESERLGWNAALSRYLNARRVDSGAKNDVAANGVAVRAANRDVNDEESSDEREIAAVFENLDFEGFSNVPPFVEERDFDADVDRKARFDSTPSAKKASFKFRDVFDFCISAGVERARNAARALASRAVWRCAWTLAAVAALAGYRHFTYFNVFPENEIGFFVPEEGTSATLELRLIGTPVLYRSEKPTNPMYGETETTRFLAKTARGKNRGVWEDFSGKIAVSVGGDATFLKIGDKIIVSGRLAKPAKAGNPGERDRRFFYRSQRVLATLSANDAASVERISEARFAFPIRIARKLETIRLNAAETLRRELSSRNAAVACGMTLGLRNEIDDATNDAFLKTGTIHLLSISGLHLALTVGAFCCILRFLGVSERWTSVATVVLVVFYLGLTDLRTPVLRAGILVFVICGAVLLRRRAFSLNSLAATAIILLFWNPCELFQLGAQLSFLATGTYLWASCSNLFERSESATVRRQAILERRKIMGKDDENRPTENVYERVGETANALNEQASNDSSGRAAIDDWDDESEDAVPEIRSTRLRRSLISTARRLRRSLGAKFWGLTKSGALIWGVGTPLVLEFSNLFAPVAILANVAIWAPATLALLAALALGAFGFFAERLAAEGIAANVLGAAIFVVAKATDAAFDVFLGALDLLSASGFGAFRVGATGVWALWLFYLPLVFWTLFPNRRPTRRTLARALAIWLALVLIVDVGERWNVCRRDLFRADVLSVGHGVAVLLFFPDGRTALVDCGSISSADRVGELISKNLWNAGKNRLDVVLLSHADYDHYSGLESIDESIKIGRVCVSPAMFQKENDELSALKTLLEKRKTTIETVVGGETLSKFGFPELSLLHPTLDSDGGTIGAESNENSLVVALERRGRLLMFPGDLDAQNAAFLATEPVRFDLILAPHHGGKSDNYRGLLDWANPTWVVVSGGSFQRNIATENALRAEGRRVLHTLDDGRVRIEIERDPTKNKDKNAVGKMSIQTFRSERRWESGDF